VIFMSVFNVHVNRSPIEGEIKLQKYYCGRFRPAYKDTVGFENEHHLLGIENGRLRITVKQIAGILARRIVSYVTLDDKLEQGELYGMIKFGSCLEVVMPQDVAVTVKKGQKVMGGKTIIGRMKD
ncbi:MAG: phosphatidylserine decarboxylase, partial [Mitsuokella jalaludinii]|nr:phosphatidylserine decarboxylase [Mitsuokella jalaludinii]